MRIILCVISDCTSDKARKNFVSYSKPNKEKANKCWDSIALHCRVLTSIRRVGGCKKPLIYRSHLGMLTSLPWMTNQERKWRAERSGRKAGDSLLRRLWLKTVINHIHKLSTDIISIDLMLLEILGAGYHRHDNMRLLELDVETTTFRWQKKSESVIYTCKMIGDYPISHLTSH